ncbi:hypothetical protein P3T36_003580 [Kitasatospora sp. MAP12-15]|nr:hypothetical protein [Kitasatospora sp. MAP12-44]
MDALRLIKTSRHALAETRSIPDVLQEAWQAAMLTEALAGRLDEHPVAEVAAIAHLLAEAGAHAAGCLEVPTDHPGPEDWAPAGRAARLSEVGEFGPALQELRQLVNEASEALIVVACGAETESVYWQCIDGVDANVECRDLLVELLRVLGRLDLGQEPPATADQPQPGPEESPLKRAPMLLLPLDPPPPVRRYQEPELEFESELEPQSEPERAPEAAPDPTANPDRARCTTGVRGDSRSGCQEFIGGQLCACSSAFSPPQEPDRAITSTAPDCEFRRNSRLSWPESSTALAILPSGSVTRVPAVT